MKINVLNKAIEEAGTRQKSSYNSVEKGSREMSLSNKFINSFGYFYCCNCYEHLPLDQLSFIDYRCGLICKNCENRFIECSYCSKIFHFMEYFTVCNKKPFCANCTKELFLKCDNCGEFLLPEEATDTHFGKVCPHCIIEKCSHTPVRMFYGEKGPYFSLEIDVEAAGWNRDNIAQAAIKYAPIEINLKENYSLYNGFRITTQPANLSYLQGIQLNKFLKALQNAGAQATYTFIIHVSREELSTNEEIKLAMLVYTQQRFFMDLARKKSHYYCKYELVENRDDQKIIKSWDKHDPLSFNRNTIEFRLFKSTLRTMTLLAGVELVHAVHRFICDQVVFSTSIIEDRRKTRVQFLNFIQNNKNKYHHIYCYLIERNWIS